ncbi:alpha/beta hydrolase [Microbacterium sp. 179-I 3D4 NHS]|uniref:alpha/beta hydrolase n=1 Tax=Microbacterium sp. 179-I 3D4 NHS TaxID=3142381 RepID=UPI00399F31B3
MRTISSRSLLSGVVERRFTVDGVPGIAWAPATASDLPTPLVLLGHPGGLEGMYPRLVARAESCAARGYASAAIELPGAGDRPRIPAVDRARDDLRRALSEGVPVTGDIVDRLVLPLVEQAAPEWRATLDALLLSASDPGAPVAWSGGVAAIAIRVARTDPRIRALGLFAGSYLPSRTFVEARELTIPAHMLLQWDDEGNDRQAALDLFDALGSREKRCRPTSADTAACPFMRVRTPRGSSSGI